MNTFNWTLFTQSSVFKNSAKFPEKIGRVNCQMNTRVSNMSCQYRNISETFMKTFKKGLIWTYAFISTNFTFNFICFFTFLIFFRRSNCEFCETFKNTFFHRTTMDFFGFLFFTFNPFTFGVHKKSYIVKQTCSFYVQVCLIMHDFFV